VASEIVKKTGESLNMSQFDIINKTQIFILHDILIISYVYYSFLVKARARKAPTSHFEA
jgi:hypothetical protein